MPASRKVPTELEVSSALRAEYEALLRVRVALQGLIREARDSGYRAYAASAVWRFLSYAITLPAVAAAAVAGLSALNEESVLAAVLAGIAATLTALATTLDPSGKATAYLAANRGFHFFAGRARQYLQLEVPRSEQVESALRAGEKPSEAVKAKVYELHSELETLRRESPYLSFWTSWLLQRNMRKWKEASEESSRAVEIELPPPPMLSDEQIDEAVREALGRTEGLLSDEQIDEAVREAVARAVVVGDAPPDEEPK